VSKVLRQSSPLPQRKGPESCPPGTRTPAHSSASNADHFDPVTKKLNVVLQINSQARSPALVEYARKHSTHDKLATESFDTAAENPDEEVIRVLGSMAGQAKKKLG
jgi:hypothetical protein